MVPHRGPDGPPPTRVRQGDATCDVPRARAHRTRARRTAPARAERPVGADRSAPTRPRDPACRAGPSWCAGMPPFLRCRRPGDAHEDVETDAHAHAHEAKAVAVAEQPATTTSSRHGSCRPCGRSSRWAARGASPPAPPSPRPAGWNPIRRHPRQAESRSSTVPTASPPRRPLREPPVNTVAPRRARRDTRTDARWTSARVAPCRFAAIVESCGRHPAAMACASAAC